MLRPALALACFLSASLSCASQENPPSFDLADAIKHEIKPHRHTIPLEGVRTGFHQIIIMLTVSPGGDVIKAVPNHDPDLLPDWEKVQPEVLGWKYTPFEVDGKAVTAQAEEFIDLVPPERLPTRHVPPPGLRPNSKVSITLSRSMCFGSCPAYSVTLSTNGTVVFDGENHVVATGKHSDAIAPDEVRKLAKKFIDADFYSMNSMYSAQVTDNPTQVLSISIDGHKKQVTDYVGPWVGMPSVVTDLEEEVDTVARTQRWIKGS